MMDVTLFRDRALRARHRAPSASVFFSIYGMLLLTTQYLQNVRGYSPRGDRAHDPAVLARR